jgi:tRNA(Ile)-lysidine synthetase-like protein
MLTVYKKDLYNYAMYNKLLWFEDSTNKDLSFLRNNIRNKLSNHFYTKRYIKSLFELHDQAKIKLNKYLYFEFNFLRDMCKVKNNALIINGTIKDLSNPIYIKLFIKKIIKHNFNINVIKRKDYWKSLNDFFIKSIHGSKFVIDNNLILLSNRNEYIVYNKKDSSNQNNAKIISSTNWYDTFFVLDTKNSFKSNLILDVFRCPQEIINQGLYVTHWNRGDKMRINNKMTKKVSDIFINNKLSLYDKKIHPIIRNDKQEILWIPKLESGKFEEHNLANVYWINNER